MKTLGQLLAYYPPVQVLGDPDQPIERLCFDSRQAAPGTLFFALVGAQSDGHAYIAQALAAGARAVVCQQLPTERPAGVCFVQVSDSSAALSAMSAFFFDFPSRHLRLVGVTGTNGKTTTATLLYQLFTQMGHASGLISTVRYIVGDRVVSASHTTPDPVRLHSMLRQMVDAGCTYCFMEVSSHAIVQKRTADLEFAGGIFTNITHDHLDYHKTFRAYIEAKKAFFDQLPATAFALVNADDRNAGVMLQNTRARKQSFALRSMADFRATIVEHDLAGMQLSINGHEFWTSFVGEFNAYNLLGVFAAATLLVADEQRVLTELSRVQAVEGRFELLRSDDGRVAVVDYAHTPDALENVLRTINQIRSPQRQLITVVGAGGDRDKTKRPIMAQAAAVASTRVILTSDNPRSEDPETILDDMVAGLDAEQQQRVLRIANRREAIRAALMLAKPGDVVLVAGKGHETYQEIRGVRHHFDDREVIAELFQLTKPN